MKITFGQGYEFTDSPNRYSNKVVEPTATLRLRLDYPLHRPVLVEQTHKDGSPWTKRQFVAAIRDSYREIYGPAADDSGLPLPANVWGHTFDDLVLEAADRGPDGVWTLFVGS